MTRSGTSPRSWLSGWSGRLTCSSTRPGHDAELLIQCRVLRPESLKQRMLECWEAEAAEYDEIGDFTQELAERRIKSGSRSDRVTELLTKCRVLRPESLKQRMLECWEAEAAEYDEVGDFTQELAERLVRQADLQPNQSVPLSS